jgi:N-acetylmuramoyl-L-alanine amidase
MTRFLHARFRPSLFLTFVVALAAGCQMAADANLPPVSLAPPTMEPAAPAPVRPVRAATAVAPRASVAPRMPVRAYHESDGIAGGVPAAWIPHVRANHWMWIIIHHSDSSYGSAAIIDKWHRARGFDELGYHFVIGNGTDSGDGQIEVGPRWTKQKWGAHDNALDNRYNTNGIGICLVGNFNETHPTPKQLHSLTRLVVYLMRKYDIPPDRVLGHGETKVTQCPGKFLNVAAIREQAARILAESDDYPGDAQYADGH